MNAHDAWREVQTRKISLVPALGLWVAETWINGDRPHNRKRAVRSISVIAGSPILAVRDLVSRLDADKPELATVGVADIDWGEPEYIDLVA